MSALASLNPDAALVLLLAGILLVYLEFNVPGKVVPGSLGMLAAMLALFSLAHTAIFLPALAMVPIALIPVFAAIPVGSRLAVLLTTLGAMALTFCLFQLITASPNGSGRVHLLTAIACAGIFSAVTVWLGRVALLARRNKRILRPATRTQAGTSS